MADRENVEKDAALGKMLGHLTSAALGEEEQADVGRSGADGERFFETLEDVE